MLGRSRLLFVFALIALTVHVPALNNGVARTPPMGWSSWDTFRYNVTDAALRVQAQKMIDLGLAKAGYNYILIDDGWMACAVFKDDGGCSQPAPRDAQGRLVPDPDKFPNGMNALTDFIHSLGLKIGIYTAVSATTCGGFPASLGHEATDGTSFAEWGFDFVKHDTCNYDCGIHDGCLQNSTMAMSNAILASGKPIVYYIDDGNNSSGMRIWNPFQHSADEREMIKIATKQSELVWEWGPSVAHMWKLWFDIHDEWYSTLDTIHQFRGIQMHQTCGNYNHPDMLTIGSGGQTFGQYRAQFFLWIILGAPLFLDCNLDNLNPQEVALLTHTELLQIDQDADCVQGSFSRGHDGFEVYVRPLSDGTFAAVLLNTLSTAQNGTVILGQEDNWGDFYPADIGSARVRDVFSNTDLGTWDQYFFASVDGYDARFFRIYPTTAPTRSKGRARHSARRGHRRV